MDQEFETADGAPHLDRQIRVLASGAETGRSFGLVELTLPPYSSGPALHCHGEHVEGCFILEGMLALTCGDQTVMLSPGGLQIVRPGERHTCWNPTSATARMLLIYSPGAGEGELMRMVLGASGHEDAVQAAG